MTGILEGKKGLIVGIANEHSIAWGCAKAFRDAGAELAITYLNDKAYPFVAPLAAQVESPIVMPLDVRDDAQMEALFSTISTQWGKLDFLLHSIAFAPKIDLQGRVTDCSREGFLSAMDISCYSFIKMARMAEPLMKDGGCLITTSYYGGERVVEHYNMMGPVKAALEGTIKYLAYELGDQRIRVNALSPGPILTRAASGIANFDDLIEGARRKNPHHEMPTIEDVGAMAAFLASDGARHMTGNVTYIDCGYHIMG
ncbi:MAG TPA: enoyl-ACP reductase FabI [Rickettsiales bacterium]|nr:enoyl-ACP reductase FabI [Rickettsiales bacterium]